MAARALQELKNALIKRYQIKNGVTIAANQRVRFGTSDTEIDTPSGADDDTTFGTALEAGVGTASNSPWVDVLLDFYAVVPMTVAAAGSTRGLKQKVASNLGDITDAPANGAGTVSHAIVGVALQTGVSGDRIGVGLMNQRAVSAT